MKNERRKHPRYDLTLPGKGVVLTVPAKWSKSKDGFEAVAADVSLGGLRVHFAGPVQAGDVLRLHFSLPSGQPVALDVVVRWAKRTPASPLGAYTAGVAFRTDASERDIERLLHAVDGRGEPLHAQSRQVNLPFRRAVEISVRSLAIRSSRTLATAFVVAFAIWFFTLMLSDGVVSAALETGEVVSRATRAQQAQDLWVVIVSMLVAVVGIVNTLHMSVAERYREIGTMKCLGALDRFVVELFLLESLALGLVGSMAGALCGTLHATVPWLLRGKELVEVHLPLAALGKNFLIGVGAGLLLTIVGSLYPAVRAAKMAPAEAMRTEV